MERYSPVDTEDLYWLAGLLEGEGCFGLTSTRGRRRGAQIQLVMKDKDVVTRAYELIGKGAMRADKKKRKETHSTMYRFAVTGDAASNLMVDLLPLMGDRRSKRIEEVLEFIANQPEKLRERKVCEIDECNRKHVGHGYCQTHLYRLKTYGDPLILKEPERQRVFP